jgi:hypothetical protein
MEEVLVPRMEVLGLPSPGSFLLGIFFGSQSDRWLINSSSIRK